MGETSSKLKNAKYGTKVKQFIDHFQNLSKPKSNNQTSKLWFKKNLESNVKFKVYDSVNISNENKNGLTSFEQYYQKFVLTSSLKFTQLLDVRYLNNIFQIFKFKCLLNNKYNVFGEIWFTIKTGQIYQIDLKQQYKGPSGFDVIWNAQFQKHKQWNTPQNRYKYQNQNLQQKKMSQKNQQKIDNYEKSTDWNAYYNAQVQQSNDQFRQNMNKQAQEWNNYAIQKNNRGW